MSERFLKTVALVATVHVLIVLLAAMDTAKKNWRPCSDYSPPCLLTVNESDELLIDLAMRTGDFSIFLMNPSAPLLWPLTPGTTLRLFHDQRRKDDF